MRKHILIAAITGILAWSALGKTGVITVDVKKKTVDPPNPIVNVAAADAISIRLVKDGEILDETDYAISATLSAGPAYQRDSAGQLIASESPVFQHGTLIFNTKRCTWSESERDFQTIPGRAPCPAIIAVGQSATVYADKTTIQLFIQVVKRNADKASPISALVFSPEETAGVVSPTESYALSVPISLISRGSNLFWSLGMTWSDNRDEIYVLRPTTTEGQSALVRAGYGETEYQIGANVHYGLSITRFPWDHLSVMFGLSTDVPVESLSAYLGFAATAWTFNDDDAGHVFIGAGYTKGGRLAPDYVGLSTVPSTTTVASLTEEKYDFALMAGVSFSFFGGQDQFKAIFPGKKSGEPATPAE